MGHTPCVLWASWRKHKLRSTPTHTTDSDRLYATTVSEIEFRPSLLAEPSRFFYFQIHSADGMPFNRPSKCRRRFSDSDRIFGTSTRGGRFLPSTQLFKRVRYVDFSTLPERETGFFFQYSPRFRLGRSPFCTPVRRQRNSLDVRARPNTSRYNRFFFRIFFYRTPAVERNNLLCRLTWGSGVVYEFRGHRSTFTVSRAKFPAGPRPADGPRVKTRKKTLCLGAVKTF